MYKIKTLIVGQAPSRPIKDNPISWSSGLSAKRLWKWFKC